MRIERTNKKIKPISTLKPGDTFETYGDPSPDVEMIINLHKIDRGSPFDCAAVSLTTGDVYFYDGDSLVVPLNIVAKEE